MIRIRVEIVRYVDHSNPGWVECHLVDANGRRWTFVEKVPVVTELLLDAESHYPHPGVIACEIIARNAEVITIDTCEPWGVESTDGQTRFEVLSQSVVENGET